MVSEFFHFIEGLNGEEVRAFDWYGHYITQSSSIKKSFTEGSRLFLVVMVFSVQRAEAHQELSLLFPDYVDLLRSRGYASQVDQWLWTLWRGQPHGTIIKSNFLDVSRYPGKDAVRYKEFGQFLAGIAKFLRSLLLAVLTSLSSMWSVPSSTHRIPVLPSASATSVSSVEEVEIARAALADELGVPVIPPFAGKFH